MRRNSHNCFERSTYFLFYSWSINDLQCCVNFAVQQSDSVVYIYMYISPFFLVGRLHVWIMEVPRLGGESELQLLAYDTATAPQLEEMLALVWGQGSNLHHHGYQLGLFPLSHNGTSYIFFQNSFPLWFFTRCWVQFPVLYCRTLLFVHSIYIIVCIC